MDRPDARLLSRIAAEHGTPCYVYDADAIRANARLEVVNAFEEIILLEAQPGQLVVSALKMLEAIKFGQQEVMLARLEGLLFDPVYSGKALAGMIDYIRNGRFATDSDIVFLHTGGAAGLFAYADNLALTQ